MHYEFPGTERTAGKTLKLTWYDGEGQLPPRESLGLPESVKLPRPGSVLIGEKGSLLIPHVAVPRALPRGAVRRLQDRDRARASTTTSRGPTPAAATGKTTSHFDYAGPLTETVLLGTVAIRVPGETLRWDAAGLRVTNSSAADALLRKTYRKGWEPAWVS